MPLPIPDRMPDAVLVDDGYGWNPNEPMSLHLKLKAEIAPLFGATMCHARQCIGGRLVTADASRPDGKAYARFWDKGHPLENQERYDWVDVPGEPFLHYGYLKEDPYPEEQTLPMIQARAVQDTIKFQQWAMTAEGKEIEARYRDLTSAWAMCDPTTPEGVQITKDYQAVCLERAKSLDGPKTVKTQFGEVTVNA